MRCQWVTLAVSVVVLSTPRWGASRDASRIVVQASRRQGNITTILDVAPAGEAFLFRCFPGEKIWVYRQKRHTPLPDLVKHLGARQHSRLFSADGDRVLSCDGKQIYWQDLQSGARQAIVSRKRGESLTLHTLSPDRRLVAYSRWKSLKKDSDYGTIALHVVRSSGGEDRQLHVFEGCHDGVMNIDADWWSPDGRRIAIDVVLGDDGGETLVMDIRRREMTKMSDYCAVSAYMFDWSWSPDSKGKLALPAAVSRQVKAISLTKDVVRGEEVLRSLDGKYFAFVTGWLISASPSQSTLWLISARTGQKQLVSRNCPTALWSKDGKRLYFARGRELRVLKIAR